MPGPLVVPIALGIGQILGNLFGGLFGAHKQSQAISESTKISTDASLKAAQLQKQSIDEALAYQKEIDARDYRNWLTREARDRTDWENSEQRRAPYRALGDSAIRTLADYIQVPGMHQAQEVPVQHWSAPPELPQGQPMMPRGGSGEPMPSSHPMAGWNPSPSPSLLDKYGRRPSTLRELAL